MPDDYPDYPEPLDDGDRSHHTWTCEHCGEANSDIDGECQFCDGAVTKIEDDPAWQSEAWLRDMEGYGNYEGFRSWP